MKRCLYLSLSLPLSLLVVLFLMPDSMFALSVESNETAIATVSQKDTAVTFPPYLRDILDFSIRGFEMFSRSGDIDGEGKIIHRLLKKRGSFALLWCKAKWMAANKKETPAQDKAIIELMKAAYSYNLFDTVHMLYKDLSYSASNDSQVVNIIVPALMRLNRKKELRRLIGYLSTSDPFNTEVHFAIYKLDRTAPSAPVLNDMNAFKEVAEAFICKERSRLILSGWWKYFDKFRSDREKGIPVCMKYNNCHQVEKVLREYNAIHDDCLPVGKCKLIQATPRHGLMTIVCPEHGSPTLKPDDKTEYFLFEYKLSPSVIRSALSKGVGRDNIAAYVSALVWSLYYNPSVDTYLAARAATLMSAHVHPAWKCLVLRYLYPALARTGFETIIDVDGLTGTLVPLAEQSEFKVLRTLSIMTLLVLHRYEAEFVKSLNLDDYNCDDALILDEPSYGRKEKYGYYLWGIVAERTLKRFCH